MKWFEVWGVNGSFVAHLVVNWSSLLVVGARRLHLDGPVLQMPPSGGISKYFMKFTNISTRTHDAATRRRKAQDKGKEAQGNQRRDLRASRQQATITIAT